VFHVSILGGLELCLGGRSPPKAPRGAGTASHAQLKTSYGFCGVTICATPTEIADDENN